MRVAFHCSAGATRDVEHALGNVRNLLAAESVDVHACRNSLDARNLDEADLLDRVEPVPAGVATLARLQEEGYRYLKVP